MCKTTNKAIRTSQVDKLEKRGGGQNDLINDTNLRSRRCFNLHAAETALEMREDSMLSMMTKCDRSTWRQYRSLKQYTLEKEMRASDILKPFVSDGKNLYHLTARHVSRPWQSDYEISVK